MNFTGMSCNSQSTINCSCCNIFCWNLALLLADLSFLAPNTLTLWSSGTQVYVPCPVVLITYAISQNISPVFLLTSAYIMNFLCT